jgi:hypothetical protein
VVEACFVALVAWMGGSTPARATPPNASVENPADQAALALQLYMEGCRARQAQRWEVARLLFLRAWGIQRHWQIAANLADTELVLGRYRDAAEHAAIFMHDARDVQDVEPRQRAEVERILVRAREKIGVITVTAPPGAEIFINKSSVGKAPLDSEFFVEPGRTVIEARLDGYQPSSESRDLAPGGAANVGIRLVPVRPRLTILGSPPATSVPVRGGTNKAIVGIGIATSAVALGMGAGFTGWWAHLEGNGYCLNRTMDQGRCIRTWASVQTASIWTLVGGGLVGAGTVTYALVAPKLGRTVKASALVGPSGAAASISLDW